MHANQQTANVVLDTNMTNIQIKKAINSKLSKDIYIKDCTEVNKDFNSRFSAVRREYIYYITYDYSPMKRYYNWQIKQELDFNLLNQCADVIIGENDFSLFSKASSETKNKICKIYESYWTINNSNILYTITGNRFLQHMVRLIVGSMVEVCKNRMSIEEFKNILNCKETKKSAVRAPARGLFLNKIYYE